MSEAMVEGRQDAQDPLPRMEVDVEAELEELHDFVRSGPGFFNHAVWLDLDEMENRLQRVLTHLPKELKRARRIAREEAQILSEAKAEAGRRLADARAEAEELIQEARREAQRLVTEDAITQAATTQAEEILLRAQEGAREVRERSFAYGRDLLQSLQTTVDSMAEQIRAGQQQLKPPE